MSKDRTEYYKEYEKRRDPIKAREKNRRNYLKNKDKWKKRTPMYSRKHKYGLTEDDYKQFLLVQSNACAICRSVNRKLYVDHNHITKFVRGLLCHHCNIAIGMFGDN